jgi:hypothetical protein
MRGAAQLGFAGLRVTLGRFAGLRVTLGRSRGRRRGSLPSVVSRQARPVRGRGCSRSG